MSMNTLKIAGTTLSNIYVDGSLSYNKPLKNVELFSVPGRSGDLAVDYGTFQNVLITYPCYIRGSFDTNFATLVNTLGAYVGYQKIECSNDTTHYRLGVPIIPEAPTVKRIGKDGYFDLSFNCKPQRFLTSGDTTTTYTSASSTVNNPTKFDSRPIIRVNGTGTCTVNGVQITVTGSYAYVDIDCEAMECYYGSSSANSLVSFSGNDFPVLSPGNNTITKGTVTSVGLTPRWWEL